MSKYLIRMHPREFLASTNFLLPCNLHFSQKDVESSLHCVHIPCSCCVIRKRSFKAKKNLNLCLWIRLVMFFINIFILHKYLHLFFMALLTPSEYSFDNCASEDQQEKLTPQNIPSSIIQTSEYEVVPFVDYWNVEAFALNTKHPVDRVLSILQGVILHIYEVVPSTVTNSKPLTMPPCCFIKPRVTCLQSFPWERTPSRIVDKNILQFSSLVQ